MSVWKRFVCLSGLAMVFELLALARTPPGAAVLPGGDATAGKAAYTAKCASCHPSNAFRYRGHLIVNDLGTLGRDMAGMTLADQEIADMQAYLISQ